MKSAKGLFAAVLIMAAIGVAKAQTPRHNPLTVKVPFEFVVGNRVFPAGTYRFRSLLNSIAGKDAVDVVEVRSMEGRLYQAVVTDVIGREEETAGPKVVFARRGGRALLSEVWEPGKQAGCRIQRHEQTSEEAAKINDDKLVLIAAIDQP
jgi:hypothetical protein